MAVQTWAVSITADRSAGSAGQSPPPQLPRHTPSRLEPYQLSPCPRSDASPPSIVQQKGQEWTLCRRRPQGPRAKEVEELGPGLQGAAVSPEVTVCHSCLCPIPGLWLLPGRQRWQAEGVTGPPTCDRAGTPGRVRKSRGPHRSYSPAIGCRFRPPARAKCDTWKNVRIIRELSKVTC